MTLLIVTVGLVEVEDFVDAGGDGDGVAAGRRGLAPHALRRLLPQDLFHVGGVL